MVYKSSESRQTQAFSNPYETVLPEHYRLIEMVGRGGMAEVFLGEDTRLGRKVAIKFLNAEFRRDPDRVRRFRQEARSASALNHPNILTIHDIGDNNGVQFIVSEFVEGETLGTRIAQGRLPLAETIDVAMQIASALSASHSAGIVHRDIKPDNVMIRSDGVVKVLDFGLAKARGFTTSNGADFDAMTLDSGSTSPGLIVGTPQYMSPEQARGKELDGRTDIFSLGILIFEMVTRNSPFDTGSFADTMAAILTKEPKRLEEFIDDPPVRLIDLVSKCLKKEREERFSSMAEIIRELKQLKGEEVPNSVVTGEVSVINTGRTQAVPTHRHSIRSFLSSGIRERTPVTAIILVAAALLVGGWWAWTRMSFISTAPSLMRTVPITSWASSASELVSSASFSPDEKLVAFAARKGDSTEIWVKPVFGGDPVQVTRNGGYNQYPIWSPDGREIAFFSDRGERWGIWRVPFTGGDVSEVLRGVEPTTRPLHWSGGNHIYYQSGREMFSVDTGSNQSVQLTNLALANLVAIEIAADGRTIAYSIKDGLDWKIRVRDLGGGSEREVASTKERIDHLAWHPNGKSIFCSFAVEGTLQIFEVEADGSSVVRRSNGDMDYIVLDVDSSGSVLYRTLSETSDLWRVNTHNGEESVVANEVPSEFWPDVALDGSIAYQSVNRVEKPERGSIKVVTPRPGEAGTISANGFDPSWSNRGDWVAFYQRDDTGLTVMKARASGIDAMRITSIKVQGPSYFFAPYIKFGLRHLAWSADDGTIAFAASDEGRTRIWLSKTDGSGSGRFLNPESEVSEIEHSPLWSDDGKIVYYAAYTLLTPPSRYRRYRLRMTEVQSGANRLLFESSEPVRLLGFDTGRRNIIFAKGSDSTEMLPAPPKTDVYSLSSNGGQVIKIVTLENAYFQNIHLNAEGTQLAFVTRSGDVTRVSVSNLANQTSRDLLVINDPKILISSLSFSQDGSFIVFGKQTRTNLLSMLTK